MNDGMQELSQSLEQEYLFQHCDGDMHSENISQYIENDGELYQSDINDSWHLEQNDISDSNFGDLHNMEVMSSVNGSIQEDLGYQKNVDNLCGEMVLQSANGAFMHHTTSVINDDIANESSRGDLNNSQETKKVGSNNISFEGGSRINDKEWNEQKAKENYEWEAWHLKRAKEAADRGDYSSCVDHERRAKTYHDKGDDYMDLARKCTK